MSGPVDDIDMTWLGRWLRVPGLLVLSEPGIDPCVELGLRVGSGVIVAVEPAGVP